MMWRKEVLMKAVKESTTVSECLKRMGIRAAGGNFKSFKEHVQKWGIDTGHFHTASRCGIPRVTLTTADVLVEHCSYSRGRLKQRLYSDGIKERKCEECGQGEEWRGKRMSLILDHVNGIHDDNRLENLRILCPNCNATLDTHCGKHVAAHRCEECGVRIAGERKFCSSACRNKKLQRCGSWNRGKAVTSTRKVMNRPSLEQLRQETHDLGFVRTGKKYGVSDNAVRKWIKTYENK